MNTPRRFLNYFYLCLLIVAPVQAQILDTGSILRDLPDIDRDLGELPLDDLDFPEIDIKNLAPIAGLGELPERLVIPSISGAAPLVEVRVENGWRALEREWLLLVDSRDISDGRWRGLPIIEKRALGALDMFVVRIRVNAEQDSYRKVRALISSGDVQVFDRNHVFEVQASETLEATLDSSLSGSDSGMRVLSESQAPRIGMIDTAVATDHPALQHATIRSARFLQDGIEEARAHGTSVASLIIGRGLVQGYLPNAQLFSASVFYTREQRSQGASSLGLLQALNWLVSKKVQVVNMSLAGPPNALLKKAVERAWSKGVPVVAAVGNAGPYAKPLFPAAWDEVIAVTAVDRQHQIYRWANQGEHLDFSALGVNINVARIPDQVAAENGTSLAAPAVSALIAYHLSQDTKLDEVLEALKGKAIDLGKSGKDSVFGYGYIQSR